MTCKYQIECSFYFSVILKGREKNIVCKYYLLYILVSFMDFFFCLLSFLCVKFSFDMCGIDFLCGIIQFIYVYKHHWHRLKRTDQKHA